MEPKGRLILVVHAICLALSRKQIGHPVGEFPGEHLYRPYHKEGSGTPLLDPVFHSEKSLSGSLISARAEAPFATLARSLAVVIAARDSGHESRSRDSGMNTP